MSDFASEHANKFVGEDEEQPLECFSLFKQFQAEIDKRLEKFIQSQEMQLSNEQIMESLKRIQGHDEGALMCLDYLLAATDYEDFIVIMLDFQDIYAYQPDGSEIY